jgi:EmrB/QacA subfamily drug resistance transporter
MIAQGTRRWSALGAMLLSVLTIGFDATILNVALPTLSTALHASTGQLQWIVDAYVLIFAGLLLPMGAIGDRYGRKRIMMFGLAAFGVASVVATYTGSAGTLIAARAVMGVGAAILTPIALAMIPVLFGPAERPRAVTVSMMAMGIGVPLGPIIGGYLLNHFWYGSIFLVNVPVVILGLAATAILVPESKDPTPRRADLVGSLLSTGGLVSFVYGVIEGPGRGWTDPVVLAGIGIGAALLAAFVAWEGHTREPMIDLSLFRRPRFLWGTFAATIASFALFGLMFVVPQYLQAVRGADALGAGIRLIPLMAGLMVGAKLAENVAARVGAKLPVAAGLGLIAIGLVVGATTGVTTGYAVTLGWLLVVGAGTGLALAPAMEAVLGELPPERSGSGTAITMTLRQVGGALGVALLGSVLASAYTHRLDSHGPDTRGLPAPAEQAAHDSVAGAVSVADRIGDAALAIQARSAYVGAMDLVLLVCAGVAVVAALLVAWRLPARTDVAAPEPADTDRVAAVG